MKKIFAVLLLLTSFACAQTPLDAKKDPALYKVSFTVMEIQNGQRSNVRNYSMYLPANARTHSTRVGNRVPVPVGKDNGIQYMDVGLNMNCSIILEKTD